MATFYQKITKIAQWLGLGASPSDPYGLRWHGGDAPDPRMSNYDKT